MSYSWSHMSTIKPDPTLIAFWYRRLKDTGFQDIERMDSNCEPFRRDLHVRFRNKAAIDNFHNKESVLRAAGLFLHWYQFETDLDRRLWEDFTEGVTIRESAAKHKMGATTAWRILEKVKAEFDANQDEMLAELEEQDDSL